MSDLALQLARAYGCPIKMAACMADNPTPLLQAVMKLGPIRVHWMSDAGQSKYRSKKNPYGKGVYLTPWSLNGKQATMHEIMRAAHTLKPSKEAGESHRR